MMLKFWERETSDSKEPLLPHEISEQLRRALQQHKDLLALSGDDIHSSDGALLLESPEVLVNWDRSDAVNGPQSYIFNFAGLDIQYPDPTNKAKDRYNYAKLDFVPFRLTDYSPKQAGLALAALYLSMNEFQNKFGDSTNPDGSVLKAPKALICETNETMKNFLVSKLGFKVNRERVTQDGSGMYLISADSKQAYKTLRSVVAKEDFNQLFRILESSNQRMAHRVAERV